MAARSDLQKALDALRAAASRYAKPSRYYDGVQDLKFASEKFQNTFGDLFKEFALNHCCVVVDAISHRLRVSGFGSDNEHADESVLAASKVWRRSLMQLHASGVHSEALKLGEGYVMVWPDASGKARLYPNSAENCVVVRDGEGNVLFGAKAWLVEAAPARLNLYYADRVEKYETRDTQDISTLPDGGGWQLLADGVITNPYGVVPVFQFQNGSSFAEVGRSELTDLIPVQDALNKSILDMLVAMEFSAFTQRWATGIEVSVDAQGNPVSPFQPGVDKLWIGGENAKFGSFESAELEQFLKVKESFRGDFSAVSGVPVHYFSQQTSGFPSGEALRRSETRFLAKMRDRQASFGAVWGEVMALAAKIEAVPVDEPLVTRWEDPAPLSEKEKLENELLKRQIGLPLAPIIGEIGYGDRADAVPIVTADVPAAESAGAVSVNNPPSVANSNNVSTDNPDTGSL